MRRYQELHIASFTIDSLLDADGNFVQNVPSYEFACYCYANFNTAGRKISTADGNNIIYSFAIYAGKDCPEIENGMLVRVVYGDSETYEGQVIHFVRNRKNCVLWV